MAKYIPVSKEIAASCARDDPPEGWEVVVNQATGESSRWSQYWELVLKHDGRLMKATYSRPSTEMQDGQSGDWFDDEDEDVDFVVVVPVPKMIIAYEPE